MRDDEEPIGYGRPPSWTRFKPGTSGNPRGRPRKAAPPSLHADDSPSDAILRAELAKKRRYKEAGKIKEASTAELLGRAEIDTALKGNPLAQRHVYQRQLVLEANDRERTRIEMEKRIESFETMVSYRKLQASRYEAATAEEAASFSLGPHPDDILLNHSTKSWRVRGPFDRDDLARFEYLAAERHAHYLASIIHDRTCKLSCLQRPSLPMFLWTMYDALLPLRWQLTRQPEFENNEFRFMVMPLRALRRLHRGARTKAEWLRPFSGLFPPTPETCKLVNAVMKPILKPYGYRSYAQFERACEQSDGTLQLALVARNGT